MIVSHANELPLEKCPALVLNADYRPLSYYPLSLWCWQDVVRDVFLDRVNIVSEYDREIRSPSFSMKLPKSKGGITSWENVATACTGCNVRKGNRLSSECGMYPKIKPFKPTDEQLHKNGRNFPPNFLHQSWLDYLYWDVRLEP